MPNRSTHGSDYGLARGTRLLRRCSLAVLFVLTLVSCAGSNYAPVRDLEKPRTVTWGAHKVRAGETLYSIAWRYGRDYRELARANGIKYPYTIYAGQRISLSVKASNPATKTRVATAKTKPVAKSKTSSTKPSSVVRKTQLTWRWPVQGKIVSTFSNGSSANKGIDIRAKVGAPVRAAADGTVVYAGSGLIGYCNLIII